MAVVIDWDLTEPPQKIDQVAAFRPGQVPTAAEMNEYINLLISQGNYNTAWLVMIAEKLTNSLVADINTQLGQITIDLETMYGTQTAAMQAIIAQIDAAADQAVLDMKAAVADTEYGAVASGIHALQEDLEEANAAMLARISKVENMLISGTVETELADSDEETLCTDDGEALGADWKYKII